MRWHNDRRLAREVPEIHLILGGHDHDYRKEWVSTCNLETLDAIVGIKGGINYGHFVPSTCTCICMYVIKLINN